MSNSSLWRIVVIDDSPDDRADVRRMLLASCKRRYRFIEAGTGAAGIAAVWGAEGGAPDCVVLGYNLPDMQAPEVLAALQGANGLLVCAVVVITGNVDSDSDAGAALLQCGAQDFIGKGWVSPQGLTRAVENAVQRQDMAQALRDTGARLELALEASATGIWSWDVPSGAVHCSRECYAIAGLPDQDFAGTVQAFDALLHADDRERVWARVNAAMVGHTAFEEEFRIVTASGPRWTRNVGRAVYAGDGSPLRVVGTVSDITARKQAEQALRDGEAFSRTVFESSPDCVKVLDTEGRLLRMNVTGLCSLEIDDFGSMVGRRWPTLWPPNDRPHVEAAIAAACRGEVVRFEAFCPTVKGTPKWWHVAVTPVRSDDDAVVRLVAVSRDVTEDRHRRSALNASHLQLEQTAALLDALSAKAPIGLAFVDCNFRFVRVNAALAQIDGMPIDAYFGHTVAQVVPKHWPALEPLYRRAVVEGQATVNFELTAEMPASPGQRGHWLASYYPVHAGGVVQGVGVVVVDITAQKLTAQLLREADQRKDEFLATLAHELRNPLAPMRNAIELMRRTPDETIQAHAREVMARQLGQLVRLIDDLLDVSRINTGKLVLRLQRTALADVLRQAIETTQPHFDAAHHVFAARIPSAPIVVEADAARLAQVFGNLLHNASKYTEAGGQIALSVEQQGAEAVVSVRDNGSGIAPEMLTKVFDMFAQVDAPLVRMSGGLGIGLSLVRRLVQMHCGSVQAHSAGLGQGCEFVVRLPLASQPVSATSLQAG